MLKLCVVLLALAVSINASGMYGAPWPMSYAPVQSFREVTISQPQQVISVQPPPRYVYGPQQTIVQQPPPRYVHVETPPRVVEVERPVIQTVRQNVYVPVDRHITQTYVRPVYQHVVQQAPPQPAPAPIVVYRQQPAVMVHTVAATPVVAYKSWGYGGGYSSYGGGYGGYAKYWKA